MPMPGGGAACSGAGFSSARSSRRLRSGFRGAMALFGDVYKRQVLETRLVDSFLMGRDLTKQVSILRVGMAQNPAELGKDLLTVTLSARRLAGQIARPCRRAGGSFQPWPGQIRMRRCRRARGR